MASTSVLTLDQWNTLLDTVNTLAANRPGGTGSDATGPCPMVNPLPHLADPHIWVTGDIKVVQDNLTLICSTNTFTDPNAETSHLWLQGYIDEINTAVTAGWCGCSGPTGPPGCSSWSTFSRTTILVVSTDFVVGCGGVPAVGSDTFTDISSAFAPFSSTKCVVAAITYNENCGRGYFFEIAGYSAFGVAAGPAHPVVVESAYVAADNAVAGYPCDDYHVTREIAYDIAIGMRHPVCSPTYYLESSVGIFT